MGREIRRVPPNWEHPKKEYLNHRLGRMEEGHQPLYDQDAESRFAEWQVSYAEWLAGEFDRVRKEHPNLEYQPDQPYRAFCAWHGSPPDPEYYRPKWDEATATWYQMYETVSEGTPVSPPFSTKEELIEYLVAHGDFWDQKRRKEREEGRPCSINCDPWDRESAERFVNGPGWAPSMIVQHNGDGTTEIKTAGHGL